jgi:hypothetical protein
LLETLRWGYFDDLLIGNFMKTEAINTSLYPDFTPIVAKLGGNAKVFSRSDWRRFWGRYLLRDPIVFARYRMAVLSQRIVGSLRNLSAAAGVKEPLKRIYRRLLGDPI